MVEDKPNLVQDGKGGWIKFPAFITQADMDLVHKEFVAQDGDVFIVTYPRSGTTWTEQMVHLLLNRGVQGEQRITDAVPWLETLPHRPNGMSDFLKTMQGRRAFTSHLPQPLMPHLASSTARIVYVARNPKDVAVSTFFHDQSKSGYEGTWQEHFQLFMHGEVNFGSYFDHVLPWYSAASENKNIVFLKYEDLKHDHRGSVAKLASFLDIGADAKLIDTVVDSSSFRAMTGNQNTNFDWVPQKEGKPKHFRRGDIGDWRNHFSPEQSQQMDDLFMAKMQGTGLQFDFGDGVILP